MKFILNSDFPNATIDQQWDQFRIFRDHQLTKTDWTQIQDNNLSDIEKAEYKKFRQFLRDAPGMGGSVLDLEIPYVLDIQDYKMKLKKESYKPELPSIGGGNQEIRSSKQRKK